MLTIILPFTFRNIRLNYKQLQDTGCVLCFPQRSRVSLPLGGFTECSRKSVCILFAWDLSGSLFVYLVYFFVNYFASMDSLSGALIFIQYG